MKINLLVMIVLTILLVVLTPLLVMGIINLGNNIKPDEDIKSEKQVGLEKNEGIESELPPSTTTLILTYPSPIPTYTPLPTYTPVPTYTPLPTYTPYPTTPPTPTTTPASTPTPTNTPIPTLTPINTETVATTKFANQRYAFTPLIGLCDFSSSLIPKLSSEELAFMNKNKLSEVVRFFPSKIFDDETTKIVTTGNIETFPVKLHDDGTHGDDIANDGLFSRACISKTDLEITLT
ncbi:MAG TPA: choice-of-anchor X domain-containing protein, partial [SAR202 cluster bacterium]|nr:choice-of-anchor X domain-containing protein [SAR202 cluster bacterium]